MSEKNIHEKAVNFAQYDEGESDWSSYGSGDDPNPGRAASRWLSRSASRCWQR